MHQPLALIAICTGALLLSACDKTSMTPRTPQVDLPASRESGATTAEHAGTTASTTAGTTAGTATDRSVPSAASVFPTVDAGRPEPTSGRSNRAMSAAQESTAMPMPGQNNDHSAPVVPARPASAP